MIFILKLVKYLSNIFVAVFFLTIYYFTPIQVEKHDNIVESKDVEQIVLQEPEIQTEEKVEQEEIKPEIDTYKEIENTRMSTRKPNTNTGVTSRSGITREVQEVPEIQEENTVKFVTPCKGKKTQGFSSRHPAVDICNSIDTEIHCAADGICIKKVYSNKSYGNHIIIEHSNGYKTLYAHLNSISIELNQEVNANDIIGYMGSTGNSTGSHLHFEIHKNGVQVNPLKYITLSTN